MSAFEEARQEILNSLDETELFMFAGQLTSLPAEIGQLHSLEYLCIIGSNLTSLPAEIGQLHSLKRLDLIDNELTNLPVEIGQLHSLKCLDLRSNNLTNLPAEIGQLHSLKCLDLRSNNLTNLPAEIEQLLYLEDLYLLGNPIQDLSALANHPNQDLCVHAFGMFELPRRYWKHLSQWKGEWLLTESNSEIRRVLIQYFGYDRIMQEFRSIMIDRYREYILIQIYDDIDVVPTQPIHLLRMICPSTGKIHVLRVPHTLTSAREAIRWVNWDIDPEAFAVET